MSSQNIAIKVENLSKCYQIYHKPNDRLKQFLFRGRKQFYREFWAVSGVSFEIQKGETVGIVGRNGSGKSTLLQMICGTLNPKNGSVVVNGRISALLELGSGFNPEFTGKENIYLNASILGLTKDEIDQRYDEILAFADIGDFVEQPVKTYSSGMLMRLAFSVAINVEPDILVVDEALAVGDERFQRKCFSRMETMKNNGVSILIVSHSSSAIVELCNKAILMDGGEILATGYPKDVVGIYQRLIYAPQDRQSLIRKQILSSFISGSQNATILDTNADDIPSILDSLEIGSEHEEFFDGSLTSSERVEYETQGVEINSATLFNISGRQVNLLKHGETYRYKYEVRFNEEALNVRFGMMIKTISGIEIGGGVSASSFIHGVLFQPADTRLVVEFDFLCSLNPGTYFLNAGVTGFKEGHETYLHRVLDACMFKVMPQKDALSTGIVDFNCIVNTRLLSA